MAAEIQANKHRCHPIYMQVPLPWKSREALKDNAGHLFALSSDCTVAGAFASGTSVLSASSQTIKSPQIPAS
jgi:ubiquinone biosynthesis protein COQ9